MPKDTMKPGCPAKDMGKRTQPDGGAVPGNMGKVLSGDAPRPADHKGK